MLNLFDTITGYDTGGTWFTGRCDGTDTNSIDITDPTNVDFSTSSPSTYSFSYSVSGIGCTSCTEVTVAVQQYDIGADGNVTICNTESTDESIFFTMNLNGGAVPSGGSWVYSSNNATDISVNLFGTLTVYTPGASLIGGGPTLNFQPTTPGVYEFTYSHTNAFGCTDTASLFLDITCCEMTIRLYTEDDIEGCVYSAPFNLGNQVVIDVDTCLEFGSCCFNPTYTLDLTSGATLVSQVGSTFTFDIDGSVGGQVVANSVNLGQTVEGTVFDLDTETINTSDFFPGNIIFNVDVCCDNGDCVTTGVANNIQSNGMCNRVYTIINTTNCDVSLAGNLLSISNITGDYTVEYEACCSDYPQFSCNTGVLTGQPFALGFNQIPNQSVLSSIHTSQAAGITVDLSNYVNSDPTLCGAVTYTFLGVSGPINVINSVQTDLTGSILTVWLDPGVTGFATGTVNVAVCCVNDPSICGNLTTTLLLIP